MCDINVLRDFFSNLGDVKKIVFVGDDAQIPSVGAGNFLYDCINSGVLDIKKLTKVFRQKEGGILDVATKTRQGEKFINTTYVGRRVLGKNFVVDTTFGDTEGKVLETYEKLYKSQKWAPEDIVVLTPTNKGTLGTTNINYGIQKIVNPPNHLKSEIKIGERIFREGDLVMNTVNDYKAEIWIDDVHKLISDKPPTTEIFNGESGTIHYVNEDDKYIVVDIDGKLIKFDSSSTRDKIVHSWCISIHKSQGSQFKIGILLADKSSAFQLNANLLYTGVSRFQEYLLLLGQSKTINIALTKFANLKRNCFLQELLQEKALQSSKNML